MGHKTLSALGGTAGTLQWAFFMFLHSHETLFLKMSVLVQRGQYVEAGMNLIKCYT